MPMPVTITFNPRTHEAAAHPDPVHVCKTPDPPNGKFDRIRFNGADEFLIRFENPDHFPDTPNPLPGGPGNPAITEPISQDVPENLGPGEDPYKYIIVHVESGVETDPGYRVEP